MLLLHKWVTLSLGCFASRYISKYTQKFSSLFWSSLCFPMTLFPFSFCVVLLILSSLWYCKFDYWYCHICLLSLSWNSVAVIGSVIFQLPTNINIPLTALNVHLVCNVHPNGLSVPHRSMPPLPWNVEDCPFLQHVINLINRTVCLKVDLSALIQFDGQDSFVISSASLSLPHMIRHLS